MRPFALRPAFFGFGFVSDFSGLSVVTVAKSDTLMPRRAGVVGRYLRLAMCLRPLGFLSGGAGPPRVSRNQDPRVAIGGRCRASSARRQGRLREDVDLVAFGEGDDGALGLLAPSLHESESHALPGAIERVDLADPHAPDRLDSLLDLGLVRGGVHDERVPAVVEQRVALLADDRFDDHVVWVLHAAPSSVVSSTA